MSDVDKLDREQAILRLERGEIEEVRDSILRSIEQGNADLSLIRLLCGISLKSKDYESGLRAFQLLSSARPHDSFAASGLVCCLRECGMHVEASKEMARFRAMDVPPSDARSAVLAEFDELENSLDRRR